jgi:hypothetical protein
VTLVTLAALLTLCALVALMALSPTRQHRTSTRLSTIMAVISFFILTSETKMALLPFFLVFNLSVGIIEPICRNFYRFTLF